MTMQKEPVPVRCASRTPAEIALMAKRCSSSRAGATPTLIDVARVAGVSPITVSRTLGRPEAVAPATRRRVLEAVRATAYVPMTSVVI